MKKYTVPQRKLYSVLIVRFCFEFFFFDNTSDLKRDFWELTMWKTQPVYHILAPLSDVPVMYHSIILSELCQHDSNLFSLCGDTS